MITFALCAVGFLGLTYLMHEAHKRDRAAVIADCDALLDETRARVEQANGNAEDWRELAEQRGEAAIVGWRRRRDLHNALTAERAYSAACDRQLRALAEQLAGKCLWPTLADDDVVVEFPKRGA